MIEMALGLLGLTCVGLIGACVWLAGRLREQAGHLQGLQRQFRTIIAFA